MEHLAAVAGFWSIRATGETGAYATKPHSDEVTAVPQYGKNLIVSSLQFWEIVGSATTKVPSDTLRAEGFFMPLTRSAVSSIGLLFLPAID
jgi:hypothetical protein